MPVAGNKLGVLITAGPEQPGFAHALALVRSARQAGVGVHAYLLDEAVNGLRRPELFELHTLGAHVFACSLAVQRSGLPWPEHVAPAGLGTLSDLIASTDRFVSFT